MSDAEQQRLDAVAEGFGHHFHDAGILRQAMTHASYCDPQLSARERLAQANERLEFLGDALLDAMVGLILYERHPEADEGGLSRAKSRLVSRRMLASRLDDLGLLDHCRLGKAMDGETPRSVKANLAEGVLAALYLDGGWDALRRGVERLLGAELDRLGADRVGDAKNRLQTLCLERWRCLPTYTSRRTGGSDHEPTFTCTVSIAEHSATGEGRSRRRSESAAALSLLETLEEGAT